MRASNSAAATSSSVSQSRPHKFVAIALSCIICWATNRGDPATIGSPINSTPVRQLSFIQTPKGQEKAITTYRAIQHLGPVFRFFSGKNFHKSVSYSFSWLISHASGVEIFNPVAIHAKPDVPCQGTAICRLYQHGGASQKNKYPFMAQTGHQPPLG